VVQKLKSRIEGLRPRLDPRLKISYINDFSKFVERRIGVLSGNLYLGLVLVLILLALILEIRVALLVSLGIPFAFLGTMAIFNNWGYSLNLVSLIGFIIVSGMLVDDAIVVTDNAVRLMEEGKDPETAAIQGTQEIWPAITASVLTTVLAFAPMLFMSGIFGKFIREIPLGVILALLISLFEAFFILPAHKEARADCKVLGRGRDAWIQADPRPGRPQALPDRRGDVGAVLRIDPARHQGHALRAVSFGRHRKLLYPRGRPDRGLA
jgi:multidrug efflux pump subunit AcrB